MNFLGDLGRRITLSTDDHRESAFLSQRLFVLIQCYTVRSLSWVLSPTQPPMMKCSCFGVSAFVLVFSLVFSPQNLYYRGQK